MQLTRDDLERVLKQTQESAQLASNAVDIMATLLFPQDDEDEPPALSPEEKAMLDLWNVAAWMCGVASGSASDAITLLNGGTVDRAEDESLDDMQDFINEKRTKLVLTRNSTPELADPDAVTFIYKPQKD